MDTIGAKPTKLKWRNFKTNPPDNVTLEDTINFECDPVVAYFIYRYTHRPWLKPDHLIISHAPRKFQDGHFEGYRNRLSPYDADWIEILYWAPVDEVNKFLLDSLSP